MSQTLAYVRVSTEDQVLSDVFDDQQLLLKRHRA
jgi:DNA invertase Pin-like site-specific DNA recombinase